MRRPTISTLVLAGAASLCGCGWILDGVERLLPKESATDAVCSREVLHVALSAGPYPPFVFPVIDTANGARVTGLDIDLVRAIEDEFLKRCAKPIRAVIRLVPFLDLFTLMQERKVDVFISATPSDVAGTGRGGLAYSLPYFSGGGLAVIARTGDIAEQIRQRLLKQRAKIHAALTRLEALSGYRIAVVDGSSGAAYAQANATTDEFIVCNTLAAALHAEESLDQPADLILGSAPVLTWMARHHPAEWTVVRLEGNAPLLLTHENFSIVVREDRLYLLWFLNNLLFELENAGELDRLRQRWLHDDYDVDARALEEGLSVSAAAKEEQARRHCYVGHPGFGRLRTLGRE